MDKQIVKQELDQYLEVEFTFLQTDELAQSIAQLEDKQQHFILSWIKRMASTNVQLAYEFACRAEQALQLMDETLIDSWCIQSMDAYDAEGLYPAMKLIKDLEGFKQFGHLRAVAALFEEAMPVLSGFIRGLSGRSLELAVTDEAAWTDGETLYLPKMMAVMPDKQANFQLYKALCTHLWAQTRFGSLNINPQILLAPYQDKERALRWFHYLETQRLNRIIAQELPGLYRHMQAVAPDFEQQLELDSAAASQQALADFYHRHCPDLPPYAGRMNLIAAWQVREERLQRDKARFRTQLKLISDELNLDPQQPFQLQSKTDADDPLSLPELELIYGDQLMPIPEQLKSLLTSIQLDLTEIPEDYLVPAGEGEYDARLLGEVEEDPNAVWSGTYHEEGAYFYDEWDHGRQHYRKRWCVLREIENQSGDPIFYAQTLHKYRGLVKSLHRSFEVLKGENKALRRQVDGEDLDLDAIVNAWADMHHGEEMSQRLFIRTRKEERSIAALFMVDMSGSTKGWINEAEREALVLLAESLEILGDRYAIYGFSGWARKRCEIYRIKAFDEALNDEVKGRIAGIEPKDYTRMGAAIRHLSDQLKQVEARTKLLITLSDGKPDDYDHYYRGVYGIEDTRQALFEARIAGIHPFCITIDQEGADYLPHLYGRANYVVLDDVAKLPLKVSDIYKKITL